MALSAAVVLALVALVLSPRLRDDVPTASLPGAVTSPTASDQPSPSPSPTTPPQDRERLRALDACRTTVATADKVLTVARTGMRHWHDHVNAQLDANAGKITVSQMNAIFRRTKAAGPQDAQRYDEAVRALARTKGSCRDEHGASGTVAKQFKACAERQRAQAPVLAAAKDGMSDWKQHLSDMRRTAQGKNRHAAQMWQHTYQTAPKEIQAYERAVGDFDAPQCRLGKAQAE